MSKITIDDLPFEGAELAEAQLGEVAGGQVGRWVLTYDGSGPCRREWIDG
ncbi:putative ATP-grasp target RiPP [Streptosporangium sp. NPDC005286]